MGTSGNTEEEGLVRLSADVESQIHSTPTGIQAPLASSIPNPELRGKALRDPPFQPQRASLALLPGCFNFHPEQMVL